MFFGTSFHAIFFEDSSRYEKENKKKPDP